MKVTGVIRRIDDLGRVVVPRDMRKSLGLQEGTPLEVCATEEGILFKKYDPGITMMDIVKNLENALNDNYVELGVNVTREIRMCISDLKEILKEADGRRRVDEC
nr:MAG TPA: stage V sporulation protein T [Caudoviricetes sp.]